MGNFAVRTMSVKHRLDRRWDILSLILSDLEKEIKELPGKRTIHYMTSEFYRKNDLLKNTICYETRFYPDRFNYKNNDYIIIYPSDENVFLQDDLDDLNNNSIWFQFYNSFKDRNFNVSTNTK